jgi:predicted GNAT family acetyltransferase
MTELLHNPETSPTTTGLTDSDPAATTVRSTPVAIGPLDEDLTFQELAALSTRHLRVLVNQAYTIMDADYPPVGAKDRYEMIVEELEYRARHTHTRGPAQQFKETFRDNRLYCRFELIINGDLAAFVKYRMDGAQLVLTDGVEQPDSRDHGVGTTLMRHIVLNAHKRRLNVVPQCLMASSFLVSYPQYQSLTNPRQS